MLIEYVLDPHAKPGVDKITDESPVGMTALARAQWPLGRLVCSYDLGSARTRITSVFLIVARLEYHVAAARIWNGLSQLATCRHCWQSFGGI